MTSSSTAPTGVYLDRLAKVRQSMGERGIDVLLLSVGKDLPYLTGYQAMPLERLTMLVVPRDGEATMVVPRLEAPRVVDQPGVFEVLPWGELEDPIAIVAKLASGASTAAIGDQTWARFLVDLLTLRRVPAQFFGVFMSVNPVLAALVGIVVLNQILNPREWAGVLIVVAANAIATATQPR